MEFIEDQEQKIFFENFLASKSTSLSEYCIG